MPSVNIYLKLKMAKAGEVKGASDAPDHESELLVDSFRWGAENSTVIGGRPGQVSVRNFEITKKMCRGSLQILAACASGDTIKEATLAFRASNVTENVDFLKWTLTDGVISSYEVEASAEQTVIPSERICIRFRAMSAEFKPRGRDGKLGAATMASVDVGGKTAGN